VCFPNFILAISLNLLAKKVGYGALRALEPRWFFAIDSDYVGCFRSICAVRTILLRILRTIPKWVNVLERVILNIRVAIQGRRITSFPSG
jgi:hypothetical protein